MVASSTTGVPASSAGPRPDPVHLDVVAVAVAAVGVVGGQHVGLLLDQDGGQAAGGLDRVGRPRTGWSSRPQPPWPAVPRPGPASGRPRARSRVGVAQPLQPGHAQDAWPSAPARPSAGRPGPRRGPGSRHPPAPTSPRVATTSTTRWPAAAALAMVPAVSSASSSGCAWKHTSVEGIRSILPHRSHRPRASLGPAIGGLPRARIDPTGSRSVPEPPPSRAVEVICVAMSSSASAAARAPSPIPGPAPPVRPLKVGLVSDCYVPRLGGIEMQVHDLAQRLQARRPRGGGHHPHARPGADRRHPGAPHGRAPPALRHPVHAGHLPRGERAAAARAGRRGPLPRRHRLAAGLHRRGQRPGRRHAHRHHHPLHVELRRARSSPCSTGGSTGPAGRWCCRR